MRYETPEMITFVFEDEDVITVSTLIDGGVGGDGQGGDFGGTDWTPLY